MIADWDFGTAVLVVMVVFAMGVLLVQFATINWEEPKK